MGYFGIPFRNGVPIGLGSIVGFGAPQEFSPSELFLGGTAGAWYDPSDLTTLFTTSAGTTPVAMPGGGSAVVVGRMLDKSGNGNHAIAFNDTTARPELRARVNLLTYSEEFNNAAWGKTNTTITQNAVANPLTGEANADALFETAVNGAHLIAQGPQTEATRYTYSVYVKSNGRSRIAIAGTSSYGGNLGSGIFFDIESGAYISGAASGAVPSIANVGNGWFLVSYTWTAFAFAGSSLGVFLVDSGTNLSYAGDVTKGIYIWGADFRPANIGANVPAYQRIADANTYDTSGFPLYLRFDGIDDSMYTPANLDLSGTDKVAVFAGVRKLSDAAQGVVAELSATIASNNGTFLLAAPDGATQTYGWDSKGTTQVDAVASSLAAPRTNVLVGTADIAGDSCIIRVNGAVADTEAGDQGTGNYGTYPLFIGARNNASIWFNGHLHSLIIAGSAVSAGNISATEQWVAGKTGITI